jgi:hypothetical protein
MLPLFDAPNKNELKERTNLFACLKFLMNYAGTLAKSSRQSLMDALSKKIVIPTSDGSTVWRGGEGKDTSVHFTEPFGNNSASAWTALRDIVECKFLDKALIGNTKSNEGQLWRSFFESSGVADFFSIVSCELERDVCGARQLVRDFVCPQFEELLRKARGLPADIPVIDEKKIAAVQTVFWQRFNAVAYALNSSWCSYERYGIASVLDGPHAGEKVQSSFFGQLRFSTWLPVKFFPDKTLYVGMLQSVTELNNPASSHAAKTLAAPTSMFTHEQRCTALLGSNAPYVHTTSDKLLHSPFLGAIGIHRAVSPHKALDVLLGWSLAAKSSGYTFTASTISMLKLYAVVQQGLQQELQVPPGFSDQVYALFSQHRVIFVPNNRGARRDDEVSGIMCHASQVAWADPSRILDSIHETQVKRKLSNTRMR